MNLMCTSKSKHIDMRHHFSEGVPISGSVWHFTRRIWSTTCRCSEKDAMQISFILLRSINITGAFWWMFDVSPAVQRMMLHCRCWRYISERCDAGLLRLPISGAVGCARKSTRVHRRLRSDISLVAVYLYSGVYILYYIYIVEGTHPVGLRDSYVAAGVSSNVLLNHL